MLSDDDALKALRDAVTLSPDNVPLRLHFAQALLGRGKPHDAEQHFRAGLVLDPGNAALKIGLARAYHQQGKLSEALVVIENLVRDGSGPAQAHLLYARLILQTGEVQTAVAHYKLAVEQDSEAGDPELAQRLGIGGPAPHLSNVVDGCEREAGDDVAPAFNPEVERPTISFADVGGMDVLKEDIALKIILPLKEPHLYRAYGKAIGGGILLYGPPGCGKTYLARATAGEIAAGFLSIGISDVLDMWIGRSERNLHEIFAQARASRPCVLFFDEIDALGARRSDMHGGTARQVVNQFLSELDGANASNEGVLVLGATNAPWHMDSAFRRPGRFDRILFVPPPDAQARSEILRLHCRDKPQTDLDYEHIAKKTEHFSGADLKAVVDQAIEAKLRDAVRAGRMLPLTTKDLSTAAKAIRPSTREWFATARNYAIYSNQGGLYDDVLKYLRL